MLYQRIIIDADLSIKIGSSEKYPFLRQILPILAGKTFIHKVVYDEIKIPKSAHDQVDFLIREGKMDIVDEYSLSAPELTIYKAIYDILAAVMIDPENLTKITGKSAPSHMQKQWLFRFSRPMKGICNLSSIRGSILAKKTSSVYA